VATSNRFLDYLSSRKNYAGLAGGVVGVSLGMVGLGGPYWPVFVAALYAAGALAMPQKKVNLVIESTSGEVAELRRQLRTLVRRVNEQAGRLPQPAVESVRRMSEMLGSVVDRPEALAGAPDQLQAAGRIIQTDLPASLETFLNLPPWFARRRNESGRSPSDELLHQLRLLEGQSNRLAEQVFGGKAEQMSALTDYLESMERHNELES
jgi:hypothetical protein